MGAGTALESAQLWSSAAVNVMPPWHLLELEARQLIRGNRDQWWSGSLFWGAMNMVWGNGSF